MTFRFYKYHGAGNDFIIIDNRKEDFFPDTKFINFLCHRQFGIGADGLMLLSNHDTLDFSMQYFNVDGNEGSMCGNGGRCISAFYYENISPKKDLSFNAIDGIHHSEILQKENSITTVCLHLNDVNHVERINNDFLLDTGSPHFVRFVEKADEIDVKTTGRNLRYHHKFAPAGVNVNFVEIQNDKLYVRTYERGVEDETLSCGTGVTASAIAASFIKEASEFDIITRGGKLNVSFQKESDSFINIRLMGPATFVFSGEIEY